MNSNVSNLHSLLSGKWLITDEFANSLSPYLFNILSKGELPEQTSTQSTFCFMNSSMEIYEEEDYNNTQEEEQQQVVAIINMKGAIMKYSQWCGPAGTREMRSMMERWKSDDNVVGVLFDTDSGGGQVAGTPEFAEYIFNYPKPTVTYSDGVIGSAAYYLASPTNEIVMNPHADIVGSIGTMTKYLVLDGYFKKLGAKVVEAYASKSTKKNNASREAAKGNLAPLIKEELDPINEKFHSDVKTYRPAISAEVFDGRHILDMQEAQRKGLIDTIADKSYAINRVFELSKTEDEEIESNNNSNMANQEINFKSISAVLGIDEGIKLSNQNIFGGKKGVFLNEAQLQLIEGKLSQEKQPEQEACASCADAESKVTALENATTAALQAASLDPADSTEASIKLLGEKVAEYGSQPGETPTQTGSDGDRFNDEDGDTTQIMDSIYK